MSGARCSGNRSSEQRCNRIVTFIISLVYRCDGHTQEQRAIAAARRSMAGKLQWASRSAESGHCVTHVTPDICFREPRSIATTITSTSTSSATLVIRD